MSEAFDAHAPTYASAWDGDPSARAQRERVHDLLAQVLAPGGKVLDLGCGTGTDAARLARLGYRIVAVDRSDGMLAVAARACEGLDVRLERVDLARPEALPAGPFDAAVSDFGALNCVPLAPVARALASRVRVGGVVVVVVMSHRSVAETVALLLRGHPREAIFRRRRPTAPVEGVDVPVTWLRPADVRRAFAPDFVVERVLGLGVVLPPPGATGRPFHAFVRALAPVDRVVGKLPVARRYGDHVLYVLRRTADGGRRTAPTAGVSP